MFGVGQNATAAKPPSSMAERRMAKRKVLIQEHIEVAERPIAGRVDAQEREALMEVVADLRRRVAEIDAAEYAEAWVVAHSPRKMPEARVAKYREAAERANNDFLRKMSRFPSGMSEYERLARKKDCSAAVVVREYEGNGFVEIFENEDFGSPGTT